MGNLGYKNTDIIEEAFVRLNAMIEESSLDFGEPSVERLQYGDGSIGMGTRNKIFLGFE